MATTTVDPTEVFPEDLNQNSTNYERWRLAVKNYLLSKELWDVVEDHEPSKEGQDDEYKLWERKNDRALHIIQNCCGTYTNFICGACTAKDALGTLEKKLKPEFFDITDTVHNVDEHEDYKKFFNDLKIDWRTAMEFLVKNPDALRVKIPKNERIALHIAVLNKEMRIVEMCEVTKNKNLEEMQLRFIQSAIFRAVEQGHIEFIEHFLKEYPDSKEMTDAKGMNMFQYAVECRQEKVYNLIYGLEMREIRKFMDRVDDKNNSVLHLAGRLPSYGQLDRIKDATLRMQRELQWFKEVEMIVPRSAGDLMNITDSMTPRELFTKNHKELKKEAEKSMKSTATSCTVVGTLIITMMFAAAFTVPGGKNGETGIPRLLYKRLVMVYLVSDAISLCFSSTSVIIFLGILTSRYAEVDFLKLLPTKMIFGILTLFLAIITMMIAFSCALYIMFEGKPGTGIPVILLGAIPVISFVLMKFRLLKDMVDSTYGAGIFNHKKLDEVEPWKLKVSS